MGILERIKKWFKEESDVQIVNAEVKDIEIGTPEQPAQKEEHKEVLDKFHAEFHNPRLICYACQEKIEVGKIRFIKAGGDTEERAFHKKCYKKLQRGTF